MTDDQRLKWALWFSRVDLSRQRPKDVERLREELQRFCLERELPFAEADSSFLPLPSAGNAGTASGRTRKIRKEMVGRPGTTPLVAPLPLDYTIADFRHLQEKVQTLLNGLVAAHDVGAQVGSATPLPGFTLAGHFTIGPMVLGSYNYVSITGRTEDMALLALLFLLGRQKIDKLTRCPECRSFFVRVRKQLYCSRRCVTRVNQRELRKTPEGRERNRKAAQKAYKKRVQAKLGKNVTIRKNRKQSTSKEV